jgi:glycosyltransferase involved in cell wall biosynthesis
MNHRLRANTPPNNAHLPRLLLFEMSFGGHYASYIRYLVEHWSSSTVLGHLDVLVSPQFLQQHEDVVAIAQGRHNLRLTAITTAEAAALVPRSSPLNRAQRALQEWRLLCRYAPQLGTTHCLLLYFDTFQSALILRRSAPCLISGIYFRPTLHYDEFEMTRLSWKDRLQQRREAWVLPWVLKHPSLQTLFCLDPFATEQLQQFASPVKRIYLPDPVPLPAISNTYAKDLESLGILPGRTVCLLFGSLDGRKGIHPLLQAVQLLPDNLGQRLCLLLAGKIDPADKPQVDDRLNAIAQNSLVQVVVQDTFIPDPAIDAYFQRADIILAPYQRHVGMSAILVRAAGAHKPVLSSNYGLMGELTRRYRLGLAVDSTVPDEIAQGLIRCLSESPLDYCDPQSMTRFSVQNSVEIFSNTIFQHLLFPS